VATVLDGHEIHRCGKYAEIVASGQGELSPAFGAGCCSPMFNSARNAIIRGVREGRISLAVLVGA